MVSIKVELLSIVFHTVRVNGVINRKEGHALSFA